MPMKNKARFVEIVRKYLSDLGWSDAELGKRVRVNRSSKDRWLDETNDITPGVANLDKLVRVLKITDPADIAALYEAATGVPQLAGASSQMSVVIQSPQTLPTPEPAPQLTPLHLEYLRSWFGQPWATVTLADIIEGNDDQVSLLDIYVPLRVDFSITIMTADHAITGWWATPEEVQRDGEARMLALRRIAPGDTDSIDPSLLEEMKPPRQRRWPDLNVDEDGLQKIVDGIQQTILDRRSQGKETKDSEHTWYMEAHDAASVQPRFVLLGDPGSGKSSFVRHLTLCMAGELRRRAGDDDTPANASIAALNDWLLEAYTPIYLELRELFPATHVSESRAQLPTTEHLWSHLRSRQLVGSLAAFETELRRLCAHGEAILLLDGLDEVSQAGSESRRAEIKAFVAAVVRTYPKLRIIITSRSHAYRRGDWALEGFGRAEMRPLSLDRLSELAKALFPVAEIDGADDRAKAFIESLRSAEKAHQLERKLYATPLFFTLLAALWLPTQQLPSSRAELLRTGVDLLLKRWTRRRLPDQSVAERLGVLVTDDKSTVLREVLESLALKVHGQARNGSDSTIFEVGLLLGTLYEARCQVQIADVPAYLTQHAGILVSPEDSKFYFLHRSFQEHLAAAALICPAPTQHCPPVPSEMHFPDGIVRVTIEQPELWENVVQLAADDLFSHPQRSQAGWQMTALLCEPYLDSRRSPAAAFLALQIAERHRLFDLTIARYDFRQTPFAALRETALWVLTDVANFTPGQRNLAGDLLGRRPEHDTRPGVGLRAGNNLPDIAWCKVPATDAEGKSEFFYQDGKHPGLPDFWIARFPITYAQFQVFVDASDGYRNSRWWQGLAEDRSHLGETSWQQRWPIANRPRENLRWVEAVAFCRWLTAQAATHPDLLPAPELAAQLGDGWSIRLPTEWEWEKAARGWDERRYPWRGQQYLVGAANVNETEQKNGPNNLQQTSAVGAYPQGASPFGVEEMSGNVWEFCLNEYHNPANIQETGSERRSVRGGSWYLNPEWASVSARSFDGGVNFDGFRVVLAASPYLRPLSL